MTKTFTGSGTAKMPALRGRATLSYKANLSRHHMRAAQYFAASCEQIEPTLTWPSLVESEAARHRAYAIGAVVEAAAALEASVNELYLEAKDRNERSLKGIDDRSMEILEHVWPLIDRERVTTKCQKVLEVIGVRKLTERDSPIRDTELLFDLRNTLVHFKPEWSDQQRRHRDLQRDLSLRFGPAAYTPDSMIWFPDRCLGAGCARWSVSTATAFMTAFCARAGIPDRF